MDVGNKNRPGETANKAHRAHADIAITHHSFVRRFIRHDHNHPRRADRYRG